MDNIKKLGKIKNIEFLRFIFALIIAGCHFKHGIVSIDGVSFYKQMMKNLTYAGVPVDLFFIISGFFMFMTTDFGMDFIKFAKKKLIRFMPTILFVLLLVLICSQFVSTVHFARHENIFTILNLQNVGLTFRNGDVPASWFVSSLFWGLSFYFYLYKIIDKKWFNLITACIVFFCYSFWIHTEGINYKNISYVFNIGMVKAFAGIGTGYFISMVYKDNIQKINDLSLNIWQKLLLTGAEIYITWILVYYMCLHKTGYKNIKMVIVIYFVALFWLFLTKKGYFSRLLENNISVFLGKFAFAIFLTHQFIINLWRGFVYEGHMHWVISHPVLNLVILYIVIILFGILTYYLVENPSAKFLKKKLNIN